MKNEINENPYHSRCAKAKRLHNVSRRRNATIGNARHSELAGQSIDIVDGSGLGSSYRTNLLRGADRARAHAHTQSIHSRLNQMECLPCRDNIATNDIHTRVRRLDVLNHFDLIHTVALAGVDDDDIHAGFDESLAALAVIGAGTDGATNQKLLVGILGGVGELTALLQV